MIKFTGLKFLFPMLLFTACSRNPVTKTNKSADSLEILKTVLSSENFQKEIPDEIDTIYLLKSEKYYNTSWPFKLADLNIEYIDDIPDNKFANYPGVEKIDNRFRYAIPFFKIENNSATIYCYEFNGRIDYKYELQKKEGDWVITSEEVGME